MHRSYTVYFRQDKSELRDLYREIEVARNFLWCIDMIYKSTLPAMNINSISLAPHAADRAAENQDRRKWVSWLKEIEKKAEKDNVIDFDQNAYCAVNEADRELERYPEDFAIGEEPWWVMGSSKTEPQLRAKETNLWWASPPAGSFKWGVVCKRCRQDRQRDHRLHIPHELRW